MNKGFIARSLPLFVALTLPICSAHAQIGRLLDPKKTDQEEKVEDAQSQNEVVLSLHSAIGEGSAQGILLSYMAINTLGDAFVAKAYDKNVATQIAQTYGRLVESQLQSIKKLKSNPSFSKQDYEFFDGATTVYTLLATQVEHLVTFFESENQSVGSKFEEARTKVRAEIKNLLGVDL